MATVGQTLIPLNLPQPQGKEDLNEWASAAVVELQNWAERLGAGVGVLIEEFDAAPLFEGLEDAQGAADLALQRLRENLLSLSADPAERLKVINPVLRNLRDDIDLMQRTMLQMVANQARLNGAMADAGLIIDTAEGKAELYAFRQVNERFSSVQILMDALAARIDLIASVGELGDLSGLINSITTVQLQLDAVAASLSSYVLTATFEPANARLVVVEETLDGIDAALTERVTYADFNPQLVRITNVETTLDALLEGGGGSITNAVLGIVAKSPEIEITFKTLGDIIAALQNGQIQYSEFAYARDRLYANVDEMGATIATHKLELVAIRGLAAAEVNRLEAAISDGDVAIFEIATAAVAALTDPATGLAKTRADLLDEITGRVDAVSAVVSRVQSVETTVFSGTDGNVALRTRIALEEANRSTADTALASRASTLEASAAHGTTGFAALSSRITAEEAARITAVGAEATARNTLAAEIAAARNGSANLKARIDILSSVIAASDGSLVAGRVTTIGVAAATAQTTADTAQGEITTARNGRASLDALFEEIILTIRNPDGTLEASKLTNVGVTAATGVSNAAIAQTAANNAATVAAEALSRGNEATATARVRYTAHSGPVYPVMARIEQEVSIASLGTKYSAHEFLEVYDAGGVYKARKVLAVQDLMMIDEASGDKFQFLGYDSATGYVTIPRLRVTQSLIAPWAVGPNQLAPSAVETDKIAPNAATVGAVNTGVVPAGGYTLDAALTTSGGDVLLEFFATSNSNTVAGAHTFELRNATTGALLKTFYGYGCIGSMTYSNGLHEGIQYSVITGVTYFMPTVAGMLLVQGLPAGTYTFRVVNNSPVSCEMGISAINFKR